MMRIECPYCGVRDETEFVFGGERNDARPSPAVSDRKWTDYLFFRRNWKGVHRERWLHAHGCRQWFNVVRDTSSHRIVAVYLMSAPAPPLEELRS